MSGPIRVQLSRKRGWRMPPNTVKVDRTTKWGNPYATSPDLDRQQAVDLHRAAVASGKCHGAGGVTPTEAALYAMGVQMEIDQLRGFNLACWCPLDQPCHADVLLEMANAQPGAAA